MVNSMTAFATASGDAGTLGWVWELRSVNGRGLDVRLRLPDGLEALDQPARKAIGAVASRGTVNATLKLRRSAGDGGGRLSAEGLDAALGAARTVADALTARGLTPAPVDVAALMSLPTVWLRGEADDDVADHACAISADLDTALAGFATARATEGAALKAILTDQIDRIAGLVDAARATIPDRASHVAETLRANVAKLLDTTDTMDPARLAQELALIAVKADVSEELDRLDAHVAAARDLLRARGPIGRKFDFLTQEFNREANTLCSKAGFEALTRIGLDLKTVIDQMREQVQNVE